MVKHDDEKSPKKKTDEVKPRTILLRNWEKRKP